MNRRSILKALILAPLVGLIRLRNKKKFAAELKHNEVFTVPEGKTLYIKSLTVNTIQQSPECTFTIGGYLIE